MTMVLHVRMGWLLRWFVCWLAANSAFQTENLKGGGDHRNVYCLAYLQSVYYALEEKQELESSYTKILC